MKKSGLKLTKTLPNLKGCLFETVYAVNKRTKLCLTQIVQLH